MSNGAYASVRQPRAVVKINGVAAGGLIECEVENNNYASADTFHAKFSLRGMADALLGRYRSYDAGTVLAENIFASLSGQEAVSVEIFFGFPADPGNPDLSQMTSFILGRIDDMDFDPACNVVEVSGRDLTGLFMDTKTGMKWPNNSVRYVVNFLASQQGLTAVMPGDSALDVRVGNYLKQDQVHMDNSRSQWDLLTSLAGQVLDAGGNPYVVYVRGSELHFEPRPSQADIYPLAWQLPQPGNAAPGFSGKSLKFSRKLTLARNVAVVVRSSQHGKSKQAFEAVYPPGSVPHGMAPGSQKVGRQIYWYKFPNLTKQQCVTRAQSLYQQITMHEASLDCSLPADLDLMPTNLVEVIGTGTAFDQIYYPDAITRHFSCDGFVMEFRAKNKVDTPADSSGGE